MTDTNPLTTNDGLALKYRPTRLEDLAGHQDAVTTIRGMVKKQRIPNAIMLTGISGVGKTTIARMIAMYLNCEKGTVCGKCSSCLHAERFGMPADYDEVNAGTNGNKEDIEKLIASARMRPRHKIRVIYIDEAHRLSIAAVNALLKPLEEPPPQTLWMLATNEPDKIPNNTAVMGRCRSGMINLKAPRKDEIAERLLVIGEAEGFKWLTKDHAMLMAESSGGAVRDAVSILDNISDHISQLETLPKRRKLTALIEDLAVKSGSLDLDRIALSILFGLYTGNPKRVMAMILETGEYIGLINKMLNINWFLTARTVVDKHEKVWYTRVNAAAEKMIKDGLAAKNKKARLTLGMTSEVHTALTSLRAEVQSFTVDAQHLMVARLVALAYDFIED